MPPTMLMDALQGVRRKVKLLGVAYGVGIAVAVAAGLLLFSILADYLLNLPAWPRLVLSLIAVAAVLYVIVRWIIKPATIRTSLTDIAGRLEQAFPQFDDRLRSTVDFAGGGKPFGSDVMQQRVMNEATVLVSSLDLNRALVARPVWYATSAGAASIVFMLLLGLVIVSPLYTRIALSRLLSPFDAPAWPKRVEIELLGNPPVRVPVGQRVEVKMKLAKGDRKSTKALIHYQLNGGPVQQEYMQRGEGGVYTASLDAKADAARAASSLKIWMTAGDDRKEITPITVLPRLTISRVEALLTPPKYVGDASRTATVNLAEGPAIAAVGSDVALRVTFNKTLDAQVPVTIKPVAENAKAPAIAWERGAEQAIVGKWVAGESMRFHVVATDVDGFQNSGLEEYELIVRPDQNPSVQIEDPRRNEDRTPVAVVPLQAVAEDDYGVQTLKLVVDRLGDKKHWEIDLLKAASPLPEIAWNKIDGSGDRLRFRMNYKWDLAKLDAAALKPGDVLEYFLQITDNFNLNGSQHAPIPSGKLRIQIVSQEQLADIITGELRNLATQIKEIHTNQDRTKQETGDLAKDSANKPQFDPGDKAAAERLGNQQGTAAAQTKQVAGKLEAVQERLEENKSPAKELKDLSKDVNELLNNVAENPMKQASGKIASATQEKDLGKRNEELKDAVDNQQCAGEQLQNAMDRMGSVGSLAQTIEKIRDLLKQQQDISKATQDVGSKNLGKTPEQMSAEDKAKLDKAASDQEKLQLKTEKAIGEMNKLADQMNKTDPASSKAMKDAAQTAQNQQVTPNQSKASKAAKQNQQAAAQNAQKQAEIGLQMVLENLREAERRKLEELNKKLAELQEQIKNLIRRQAGHNHDNLRLQGPDRLAKLDAKFIDDLLEKAERVKDHLPAQPPLGQLTTSQEQTERNTRDIALATEDIPNGAEPASSLTRAASKMERAIVSLRTKDLPGAYEPPQVEALAALLEAKSIVDKQKDDAQKKQDEQQKEAIRVAYQKIKADQEKLNAETTRIDKSPKLPDGTIKREDAVRLGQLPGEQGKLADRTGELEEALSAVGSIVYIWANKDIVTSMNGVKDDLGKPQTGTPTQAEQARVVEQLDSMIRNLAIKPPESKFDQRQDGGGNGGGGAGGPKLPTEAELRLLRDLQQAINKSTKTIDGQPEKDKQKLLGLGNRQGELRVLLDETLQKASGGQAKLRKEPDKDQQLPEEAGKDKIDDQELAEALRQEKPGADATERDIQLVGDRMARSRQRLANNSDPGKTTQLIQERILVDMDKLIDQAQKQSTTSAQPKPGQGEQMGKPKPGEQQAQNAQGKPQPNKAATPAGQSTPPGTAARQADLSQQIKQSQSEWGRISPRTRDAVIEGAGETPIEKYRRFIEDYYKGVATRGAERP